ncbi:hypothetical protein H312_00102 [Anncaliia algerae PRA339]|uniref:Uncharacterized protein n=1 Tax=Anncaliia algerae PRA339 TaxID=1288291 RepID=A0A059F610_9MICR|nr:hypothetical protein H312_00102 [Anncaliia algerae PRA339]
MNIEQTLMFIILLINLSETFNFTESNLYQSTIHFSGRESINYLLVKYPRFFIPKYNNNILNIELKDNRYKVTYFFRKGVHISYYKMMGKIFELEYFIERGLELKVLLLNESEYKVIKFTDIYPVPDFTVPFIAFSVYGSIIALFFNFFINKR